MMTNWLSSMKQTYEFYVVDPATWEDKELIESNITGCTIDRDSSSATRGSAMFDCTEAMSECYVRVYLVATQNGVTDKVPLGTFLVQTPSVSFDGMKQSISMDAYTPLIELKGNMPPIGYSILKGEAIMDTAYRMCRENMRAPVVKARNSKKLYSNFVANLNDTWLSFISDYITNANFKIGLDEMGRIIFEPEQDIASLQPVWVYDDGNSSILYPDVEDERDLYGIPNVVEVVYSTDTDHVFSRIVNSDPNSPVSTVARGREIIYRDSNPGFANKPTQAEIDEYATQLLRNLSCLEHTLTYTHGYCPVRVGDCVMLNYKRAGLVNVKAKVVAQSIKCVTGCPVEETAVYTTKLWG